MLHSQAWADAHGAQYLTIKIHMHDSGNGGVMFILGTNGEVIGVTGRTTDGKILSHLLFGKYNKFCESFADAIEYAVDKIERFFNRYGINVEFVNDKFNYE